MDLFNNLSIRVKLLLTIVAGLLLLVAAIFLISSQILQKSYQQIEKESVINDLRRVSDAVQNSSDLQLIKLRDWATWDDSYFFALEPDNEFTDTNLKDVALVNLDLDYVGYFNAAHDPIFAKQIDNTDAGVSPEKVTTAIKSEDMLVIHPNEESEQDGFLDLPEGPLMIASLPLLQSTGEGPSSGTLIFARFLDEARIQDIADLTHLSVSASRYDSTSLSADALRAKQELEKGSEFVVFPTSSENVAGFFILRDIHNEPFLLFRIDEPRPIFAQGLLSIYTFMAIGGLAIVVFGGLLVALLEMVIVSRFTALSKEVDTINEDRDLSVRMKGAGRDEIGRLIVKINEMLSWLASSRKAEADSSKKAADRLVELNTSVDELKRMNQLMVDRELKMAEMKKEIESLQGKGGAA